MVVILAAGKGTRMGPEHAVKACCAIDGEPVVLRLLQTFTAQGFMRFMVVVGAQAQPVMETAGRRFPGLLYVHQDQPLGTGYAARIAAQALQTLGYCDPILVTMGDKYIEERAVAALTDGFHSSGADMALLTLPPAVASSESGRVLADSAGQVYDIIEKTDLARQQIADTLRLHLTEGRSPAPAVIMEVIRQYLPTARKQRVALGPLLELAERETGGSDGALADILNTPAFNLISGGRRVTAADIERDCRGFNPSLYLFKPAAFFDGIGRLDCRNAQGEYYLTDLVKHLAAMKTEEGSARYRIRAVPFDDADAIQAFNSPSELHRIENYVRRRREVR